MRGKRFGGRKGWKCFLKYTPPIGEVDFGRLRISLTNRWSFYIAKRSLPPNGPTVQNSSSFSSVLLSPSPFLLPKTVLPWAPRNSFDWHVCNRKKYQILWHSTQDGQAVTHGRSNTFLKLWAFLLKISRTETLTPVCHSRIMRLPRGGLKKKQREFSGKPLVFQQKPQHSENFWVKTRKYQLWKEKWQYVDHEKWNWKLLSRVQLLWPYHHTVYGISRPE